MTVTDIAPPLHLHYRHSAGTGCTAVCCSASVATKLYYTAPAKCSVWQQKIPELFNVPSNFFSEVLLKLMLYDVFGKYRKEIVKFNFAMSLVSVHCLMV